MPHNLLAASLAAALAAAGVAPVPPAVPLAFQELYTATPRELAPSPRLLSLSGKRVQLTGFMAKMELAPKGAFWLTPHPVVCDEAGGGIADLPPTAVYVVVRSLEGQPVPFNPSPLVLTGVLEVGHRVESDGRGTQLRLLLDRAEDLPPLPAGRSKSPSPSAEKKPGSRARPQRPQ